jgi:NAD+ synthase
VAKLHNALIIGTGNRDEDEVARYYQKRGDGAVDVSPIAKLHKSEVYQLLRFLGCTEAIINAVPTADLWGPESSQEDEKELGISYPEMEWAILENDKNGVLNMGNGYGYMPDPLNTITAYTPRQIEVLKKLQKMEQVSRHKASPPPVYDIRNDLPQLFEGYVAPNYGDY